eukprot:TRINITY_DN86307_c0_g1_i1.p1 TRINITY_DN86307_c0_g1~~TRINITY_DN86307_c0_g1_i1.p1  ORF type:complete len:127 (+),score=13.57 TRINITY_DN86307_c0_g1_i1:227-607(+)
MAWTLGCTSPLFNGWAGGPPGNEGVIQACTGGTKKTYVKIGCQDTFVASISNLALAQICPKALEYVETYRTTNRGCTAETPTMTEDSSGQCYDWPACPGMRYCQLTHVAHAWPPTETLRAWNFLSS